MLHPAWGSGTLQEFGIQNVNLSSDLCEIAGGPSSTCWRMLRLCAHETSMVLSIPANLTMVETFVWRPTWSVGRLAGKLLVMSETKLSNFCSLSICKWIINITSHCISIIAHSLAAGLLLHWAKNCCVLCLVLLSDLNLKTSSTIHT